MIPKAWIKGHPFDLETLSDLFHEGDPNMGNDGSRGYYMESATLQDLNGKIDQCAAESLIKRINGIARAAHTEFQPVSLTYGYTSSDGGMIISPPTIEGGVRFSVPIINGVIPDSKLPKGSRYMKVSGQDLDVADALRILGQPERLDWYDIYKIWEIAGKAVGGEGEVEKRGWAAKGEINRLKASANHPGISGDQARHARQSGTPTANLGMTMREADRLVRRLVANWIESHPAY